MINIKNLVKTYSSDSESSSSNESMNSIESNEDVRIIDVSSNRSVKAEHQPILNELL